MSGSCSSSHRPTASARPGDGQTAFWIVWTGCPVDSEMTPAAMAGARSSGGTPGCRSLLFVSRRIFTGGQYYAHEQSGTSDFVGWEPLSYQVHRDWERLRRRRGSATVSMAARRPTTRSSSPVEPEHRALGSCAGPLRAIGHRRLAELDPQDRLGLLDEFAQEPPRVSRVDDVLSGGFGRPKG
jgi:hypothetical protein